jgi:hypothetical protein
VEESEPEKMEKKEESGRTLTSPICMRKRKSEKAWKRVINNRTE